LHEFCKERPLAPSEEELAVESIVVVGAQPVAGSPGFADGDAREESLAKSAAAVPAEFIAAYPQNLWISLWAIM